MQTALDLARQQENVTADEIAAIEAGKTAAVEQAALQREAITARQYENETRAAEQARLTQQGFASDLLTFLQTAGDNPIFQSIKAAIDGISQSSGTALKAVVGFTAGAGAALANFANLAAKGALTAKNAFLAFG